MAESKYFRFCVLQLELKRRLAVRIRGLAIGIDVGDDADRPVDGEAQRDLLLDLRLAPAQSRRGDCDLRNLKGNRARLRQVDEHIWLVTFMHYDLGYFDDETCRLEPIENPFGPTVLPMSPE